jgi:hypothetical protein
MKDEISPGMKARFLAGLKTHVFRSILKKNGIGGIEKYDWNNGDPLYMGDPITGRANRSERKAIEKMREGSK